MTLQGVHAIIQTPFLETWNSPVDHQSLQMLVDHVIDAGVAGVVVLGLASEAWTLTELERDEVCRTVREASKGRVPLTVGTDGATAVATDRARRAVDLGADSLMVLPPGGTHEVQLLAEHYSTVARASSIPLLIQDSPQVTGVSLSATAILEIASADPLIAAVKIEAPDSALKMSVLTGAGFDVVAGWGGLHYTERLCRGAIGCMPGCATAPAFVAIHAAGGTADGDQIYRAILPFLTYAGQSLGVMIAANKLALHRMSIIGSAVRRPPCRLLDALEVSTLEALVDRLAADHVPGFVPTRG